VSTFPSVPLTGPWSLGLAAELFWLKGLRGVLRQSFYADDPTTPDDDETRSRVPDSNFYVESLRFHLALSLRATL
jgi:hypothetical protein